MAIKRIFIVYNELTFKHTTQVHTWWSNFPLLTATYSECTVNSRSKLANIQDRRVKIIIRHEHKWGNWYMQSNLHFRQSPKDVTWNANGSALVKLASNQICSNKDPFHLHHCTTPNDSFIRIPAALRSWVYTRKPATCPPQLIVGVEHISFKMSSWRWLF